MMPDEIRSTPVIQFADNKAPDALRTIGEVADALGIKQHVLRYWEEQFPMLQPIKRSGRRYYRPEDIALLVRIHRLVNDHGYTLRGARQAVEDNNSLNLQNKASATSASQPVPQAKSTPASQALDDALIRIHTRLLKALEDDQ